MKIYMVGGAVRDQLMGLEPKDYDYVVVGGTETNMRNAGLTKIEAQSFPVFHDDDGNEYAMARRERKTGDGYHGFDVEFGSDVTLEEDLSRRDLTINAMAIDMDDDTLVDPFNGKRDVELRLLRHVSNAFREDPVRVLRVARFAARYGFNVAPATVDMMKDMVSSGELDHLTRERVWKETSRAMAEPFPYEFFYVLRIVGAYDVLFPEAARPSPFEGCMSYEAMTSFVSSAKNVESRLALCGPACMWERWSAPNSIVKAVDKLQRFAKEPTVTSTEALANLIIKYGTDAEFVNHARDLFGSKPIDEMVDNEWILNIHFRDLPEDLQNVEPRMRTSVLNDYRRQSLKNTFNEQK